MKAPLLTLELRLEQDVVLARQRARQVAALLGFEAQDRTRIATAVSEMARNAFKYAGGGRIEFAVGNGSSLLVTISDRGPGIAQLDEVLGGTYRSPTGMGLGIVGTRRLMDAFEIESVKGRGTTVRLGKNLPKRNGLSAPASLAHVAEELVKHRPMDPLEEVQQQNQELLRTLEELRAQRAELAQVNTELEETNRGVVALYAELDERADYLQRANELKTRFLSNMTHEFRTPLNSIISLARILIERLDGDLTSEQEKQIRFIAKSAEDLSELVNDLLDLAKVEAGKIVVRPHEFKVSELFAALRGMLRPLLGQNSSLNLVLEDPEPDITIYSDESKLSQVLRNFISNGIKYTRRGEVRVSAQRGSSDSVVFAVSDTGIGIAPEDQERIFEEFTRVESPLQRNIQGTGLGLPLSRKLASLLGGSVRVTSEVGVGSTFSAIIPAHYNGAYEGPLVPDVNRQLDPTRAPVLVVEDNREALFVYEKYLKGSGFQVVPARTLKEARDWLAEVRPVAVVLDVLLEAESTWGFLAELRASVKTRDVPVIMVTMVENEQRAIALGADAFRAKPVEREWLLGKLRELTATRPTSTLLIIDDDEVSRYLLKGLLSDLPFRILEATSGLEGMSCAREARPSAIFLDLAMPDLNGFAVLERLKKDAELAKIPVIVHTARLLSDAERKELSAASAILPKESPSREVALANVRAALASVGLMGGAHD